MIIYTERNEQDAVDTLFALRDEFCDRLDSLRVKKEGDAWGIWNAEMGRFLTVEEAITIFNEE